MNCNPESNRVMGEKKKKNIDSIEHDSSGLTFIFPEDGMSLLRLPHKSSTGILSKKLPVNNAHDLKKISEYYFKIEKHEELFSLGKTFSTDLEKRENAFGFYHLNDASCVETIIALGSFFSSQFEISPIVITSTANIDQYKSLLGELEIEEVQTKLSEKKVRLLKGSGLYLLDIDYLYLGCGKGQYKEILEEVIEQFSASFWDLPSVMNLKSCPERYFVAFSFLQNVSLIVNFDRSNIKKTQAVIDFFKNYSLTLKGFILDQVGS